MTDHPSSGGHTCNDCACQQQCLLGRLDPQTRAGWRGHLTERRFRKGEMLQRQGESIHSVQVVKIGTLLVQRRGDDGVEHPVGMAGCCEALGAPALLQQPADLSYVAVTPGRVCQLDLAPLLGAGRQSQGEFLLELARECAVLVVACRADETNRGLISAEVIEALGPDGLLVNVARGQLVDEEALIAALKSGKLGQAALDVYEEEPTDPARWANVPNTILTPHTGGATHEAVQGMLRLLLENLDAVLNGREPVTPVR